MPENRLDTMAVKVDGRAIDTALYELLTLVRVEESVQLPDMFELRFDDVVIAAVGDRRHRQHGLDCGRTERRDERHRECEHDSG